MKPSESKPKKKQNVPVYEMRNVITGKIEDRSTTQTRLSKKSMPQAGNASHSLGSILANLCLVLLGLFLSILLFPLWGLLLLLKKAVSVMLQWLLALATLPLRLSSETISPDGLLNDLLRETPDSSKGTSFDDILAKEEMENGIADEITNMVER